MKKKSNKIPLFISEKGVPSRNRFQLFCVLQTISRQLNEWIKSAIYCTNGRADWSGLVHLRLSAVRSSLSTLCVNFILHCFWSIRAQPLVHQYYINNSDHVLNGRWRLILSPFCTAKEHICIFCFERTKTKQCIKNLLTNLIAPKGGPRNDDEDVGEIAYRCWIFLCWRLLRYAEHGHYMSEVHWTDTEAVDWNSCSTFTY